MCALHVCQDDGLVGVPSKLNRYRRAGKKIVYEEAGEDAAKSDDEGQQGGTKSMEDCQDEEGEERAGLTLIKMRLFKDIKIDEVSDSA